MKWLFFIVHTSCHFSVSRPNIPGSTVFSDTLSQCEIRSPYTVLTEIQVFRVAVPCQLVNS